MKRIYLTMLGLILATPVFAQSQTQQLPAPPTLPSVNPNAKVTKEQLQAIAPPLAAHFDEIDTKHLGYVTPLQIQQFLAKQAPQLPSQIPTSLPSPPPPLPQ